MKEKINKRQLQAIETKQRLTESIIELMGTKGYHDISIEMISNHAGVSKGTFYHYFTSKREILSHLGRIANETILQELNFDEQKTAKELFMEYIDILVRETYRATYEKEARMLIALLTSGADETYVEMKPQTEYVERILRHGQARGEISTSIDVRALNSLITSSIQGFVTIWSISQGKMELQEELHYAFSPIWTLLSKV